MSEYYDGPVGIEPFTRARAEDVAANFSSVAEAFGKLPAPNQLGLRPGGNVMAVGLFTESQNMTVPAGTNRIRTVGFSVPGVGGADYAYNPVFAPPATPGPNLVPIPDNITAAPWVGYASTPSDNIAATATFDGTYTTVSDNSNGFSRWQISFEAQAGNFFTAEAIIHRDAVPAATRKMILRILRLGGDGGQVDVLVDTMEGTVFPGDRASSSTSPAFDYGICGPNNEPYDPASAEFKVWVTAFSKVAMTGARLRLYPANGPGNSSSGATTGSVVVRGLAFYTGVSPLYVPPAPGQTQIISSDGRIFVLTMDQAITPHMFGCIGNGLTNDTTALKEFSTYITNKECPLVSWGGTFLIDPEFEIGSTSLIMATRSIVGTMRLILSAPTFYGLTLRNMFGVLWDGIEVISQGSLDYNTRQSWVGVRFKNNCGRMVGRRIKASNFLFSSVHAVSSTGDNFNFAEVGSLSGDNIGSGSATQNESGSLITTWNWVSDPISNETFTQRSRLHVDAMFPITVTNIMGLDDSPVMIKIAGYSYQIKSVDRTANTIDIYPRVPAAMRVTGTSASTGRYIWGARMIAIGGNSLMRFGVVDGSASSRCLLLGALHGCFVQTINSSFDGQGIFVGRNSSGISLANVVERAYFEANTVPEEIVSLSPYSHLELREAHQGQPARWVDLSVPRLNDDTFGLQSGQESAFRYFSIHLNGRRYEWQERGLSSPRSPTISLGASFGRYIDFGNTLTVNLIADDAPLSSQFGYKGGVLYRGGTGTGGLPTGNATFNAPAGGTVNGASSVALSDATVLIQTTDPANLTWFVRAV